MSGQFSVFIFLPDDSHFAEARFIDAERAVGLARDITRRPAARLGIITRVIITDGGDCIVFEWIYRRGVTYPTPATSHANQNS